MTNEQYREFLFRAEQARTAHLRRNFDRVRHALTNLLTLLRFSRAA